MPDNLFTTTNENEARLVQVIGESAVPGYKLTREWVYLDATVVDTLVVTLKDAGTYTNPMADNQTYTGTFVNSSVNGEANIEDNDRQGRIRQELTLVQDLDDNTDLTNAVALYKYIDEEINHLTFDSADLNNKDGWVQDRQQLQMIIPNVNPASLANLANRVTPTISNAQWEARAATLLSSQLDSTSAWEFSRLECKQERDNTLTVIVTFNDPDFGVETDQADIEDSLVITNKSNTGGYGVGRVEVVRGKDIANVETIIDNFLADDDFVIDRTSWSEGQQGEAIFTKLQSQSKDDTGYAPLLIHEQGATGNRPATATATWFRVNTSAEASLVASAKIVNNWNGWFPGKGFTTSNGFVFNDVRYNRNPNGTVDITVQIYVPRTRSFVGPDSEKKYCVRRSYVEYASRKPADNPSTLGDDPDDGKWWRTVMVLIQCMWTKSDNKAQRHAQEGLNGSFSKFMPGVGLFYAEKVLDRKYGDWKDTAFNGVAANVNEVGDGLNNEKFENSATSPVVEGTGDCGEIKNDKP